MYLKQDCRVSATLCWCWCALHNVKNGMLLMHFRQVRNRPNKIEIWFRTEWNCTAIVDGRSGKRVHAVATGAHGVCFVYCKQSPLPRIFHFSWKSFCNQAPTLRLFLSPSLKFFCSCNCFDFIIFSHICKNSFFNNLAYKLQCQCSNESCSRSNTVVADNFKVIANTRKRCTTRKIYRKSVERQKSASRQRNGGKNMSRS